MFFFFLFTSENFLVEPDGLGFDVSLPLPPQPASKHQSPSTFPSSENVSHHPWDSATTRAPTLRQAELDPTKQYLPFASKPRRNCNSSVKTGNIHNLSSNVFYLASTHRASICLKKSLSVFERALDRCRFCVRTLIVDPHRALTSKRRVWKKIWGSRANSAVIRNSIPCNRLKAYADQECPRLGRSTPANRPLRDTRDGPEPGREDIRSNALCKVCGEEDAVGKTEPKALGSEDCYRRH